MSDSEKKENLIAFPSLEKGSLKAIESHVFLEGNWPDKNWWEQFGSSALNDWIETSFLQNPSLIAVQRRLEEAKQAAQVYRAALMPTLYFDADDNYHYFGKTDFYRLLNPSLPRHGYQVDLSLAFNYEFDFWNKNRNLFKAALGAMKSQEAEVEQAKLILSTSLAQSYFALLKSFEKKALYEALYLVRLARFNLQTSLEKSSLVSKLPPLLNDEEVKAAKQLVLAAEDEIEVTCHLINILMGKGPYEELETEKVLKQAPKQIPLPGDLSIDLLSRRPDLMAQIWKADSLAAQVGAARADFFPNINLAAFAGLSGSLWNTLFQQSAKSFGYDPTISLPIYTAGSIRANIEAKKSAFDQAVFEYNNLLLQSAQEVADLLSNVRTVYRQKEQQTEIVQDAKARLELTCLRKESGLDSAFAVFDFEEELIQKQITDIEYIYHQYAFLVRLIKALGGGFNAEHIPIAKDKPHE
jgi:NodT family efflux transporter outer membrane factor (OMF) lipoprotein